MSGYSSYAAGMPRSSTRYVRRGRALTLAHVGRLDWQLIGAVLALCAIGSLLVWSATRGGGVRMDGDPQEYFNRQLVNVGIGLALALVAMAFDYRLLRVYGWAVYGVSILGLLLVLTPLGDDVNGAKAWIKIGGFSYQPSEFAKLGVVLAMAILLSERRDREEQPRFTDLVYALGLAAVPMGLIMLQPDLGTTLVMSAIVMGLVVISGTAQRWVFLMLATVGLGAWAVLNMGLLAEHQVNRLAAFLDPSLDPRGVGYNVNQSRIAIGAGGLMGKGLFEGSQTGGHFVPEQHTDFIFTVAGEELGFLGSTVIVLLFVLIIWRASKIAMRAKDLFGFLVAAGIVAWFGFQVFENIGMTVGIMPVTGIPLPYVSHGGSAMFANLAAAGLLLNIQMRSELD